MKTQLVRRNKAVVGVKTGAALKVVQSRKTLDVLISWLSRDTTAEEVIECAFDALCNNSSADTSHITSCEV